MKEYVVKYADISTLDLGDTIIKHISDSDIFFAEIAKKDLENFNKLSRYEISIIAPNGTNIMSSFYSTANEGEAEARDVVELAEKVKEWIDKQDMDGDFGIRVTLIFED
jgi:Fe-S oxidoreductase